MRRYLMKMIGEDCIAKIKVVIRSNYHRKKTISTILSVMNKKKCENFSSSVHSFCLVWVRKKQQQQKQTGGSTNERSDVMLLVLRFAVSASWHDRKIFYSSLHMNFYWRAACWDIEMEKKNIEFYQIARRDSQRNENENRFLVWFCQWNDIFHDENCKNHWLIEQIIWCHAN